MSSSENSAGTKSQTLTQKQLKDLLSPPNIKLDPPTREIHFADVSVPLLKRLADNDGTDSLEMYQLTLQSERFRLESRLHRLLATRQLGTPSAWSHLLEGIRQTLRRMHGRTLLCHEPGLASDLGLALTLSEYIMRGLVARTLLVVPRPLLGFWKTQFQTLLGFPCTVAEAWPTEQPLPEHMLLPFDALDESFEPEQLEGVPYPLIAVAHAGPLRNRRSKPWRNLLNLSPQYLLLQESLPFLSQPGEIHGYLALLGVPELPPAARLKRELGGADADITPDTRKFMRDFLKPVVQRNLVTNTDLPWPERLWKTQEFDFNSATTQMRHEIWNWLKAETQDDFQPGEEGEAPELSGKVKALTPLLQASLCSASATYEALSNLVQSGEWDEHKNKLDGLKSRASSVSAKDPRVRQIAAWLQENPRARYIVFCHHTASQQLLLEKLQDDWQPNAGPGGRVFVASDRDIPEIHGDIDFVIHFDLPWLPEVLDARSHWMLRPSQSVRHVRVFEPLQSPESAWWTEFQMRLKPESLLPEEMTQITNFVDEESQSTRLMWRWIHRSSNDEFFGSLSKDYLSARKDFRRILDLNQRLFLDDYAL